MRYYRCKCGSIETYGSMPPPQCMWCPLCGSNPAEHPEGHRERRPHTLRTQDVETDVGMLPLSRCTHCGRSRRELLEAGEPFVHAT